MSDLRMMRKSMHWAKNREEAQAHLRADLTDMQAYDGAYKAMHSEEFVLADSMRDLPPANFWEYALRNGEIHIARDAQGPVALHFLQSIFWRMHATWEVFTPKSRRASRAGLESAERVLEYCFDPSGLNLLKVKALIHPSNEGAIHYVMHLGFKKVADLPNEALFGGNPCPMILWELANPFLRVNELKPEPMPEVKDDWNSEGSSGSGGNAQPSSVRVGRDTSADGYEPVPNPWDVLQWVTDSQLSVASAPNRQPANAVSDAGRQPVASGTSNYW